MKFLLFTVLTKIKTSTITDKVLKQIANICAMYTYINQLNPNGRILLGKNYSHIVNKLPVSYGT